MHIYILLRRPCMCITFIFDTDNYNPHQVTRWYRPPELILMQTDYTAAVDVRLAHPILYM